MKIDRQNLILFSTILIVIILIYFKTPNKVENKQYATENLITYGPTGASTTVPQQMRPNSWYNMTMPTKEEYNIPIITIKLFYHNGCMQKGINEHPTIRMFFKAQDEIKNNNHSEINRNINFEIIDVQNAKGLIPNTLSPIITKIGRTGKIINYSGSSDIGEFIDWVLNCDNISNEGRTTCNDNTDRYLPETKYLGSQELNSINPNVHQVFGFQNNMFENINIPKYDDSNDILASEKINNKVKSVESFIHTP